MKQSNNKTMKLSKIPPLLQAEFRTDFETKLLAEVKKAVKAAGFDDSEVKIDHPADPKFGDFTTNVAMMLFARTEFKSPLDLAKKIHSQLIPGTTNRSLLIDKVDVLPPGFLNIWLKKDVLISQLRQVIKLKEKYGSSSFLKDKKILLEHTSPDPIKTIHIGHLRNNFLGMAMSRIFTNLGAQMKLDCINNDRGTHVSRAMLGYLVFARNNLGLTKEELLNFKVTDEKVKEIGRQVDWKKLLDEWLTAPDNWFRPEDLGLKSDHLDLIFYSLGDRSERLVEGIKEQVRQILREWEEEKPKVRALWRQIIDWSLSGYAVTYKRIGSYLDRVWHESDLYKGGKALVENGLKKAIFRKSQEAVVTDLASFNLPDTVVIKSDGTALYHTFDIYFTSQKRQVFPSDLYIWDIGNDQLLYLRQLFAICEQLGIGKVTDYFHLNHGYVYLKEGEKMSSRKGTVLTADDLLDFLKEKAKKIMVGAAVPFTPEQVDQISEKVGLAAIKYGLLKTTRGSDMHFDPETSVSLSGNSGPYLQYTCARTHSVLKKALEKKIIFSLSEYDLFRGKWAGAGSRPGFMPSGMGLGGSSVGRQGRFGQPKGTPGAKEPKVSHQFNPEESALIRTIYRYPEVVLESGRRLEPALICQFLFDLAQKFNTFYNRHSILSPPSTFRLALTAAVAQILKNGLTLLGIDPLEKM